MILSIQFSLKTPSRSCDIMILILRNLSHSIEIVHESEPHGALLLHQKRCVSLYKCGGAFLKSFT